MDDVIISLERAPALFAENPCEISTTVPPSYSEYAGIIPRKTAKITTQMHQKQGEELMKKLEAMIKFNTNPAWTKNDASIKSSEEDSLLPLQPLIVGCGVGDTYSQAHQTKKRYKNKVNRRRFLIFSAAADIWTRGWKYFKYKFTSSSN